LRAVRETRTTTAAGAPLPLALAVKMPGATESTWMVPDPTVEPAFMTVTVAGPAAVPSGMR
jgi:hypothetical protein